MEKILVRGKVKNNSETYYKLITNCLLQNIPENIKIY